MAIYKNERDSSVEEFHIKNSDELNVDYRNLEIDIFRRFTQLCANQDTIKLDSGKGMLNVRSYITGDEFSIYPIKAYKYRILGQDVNSSGPEAMAEYKLENLASSTDKICLIELMEENIIEDE